MCGKMITEFPRKPKIVHNFFSISHTYKKFGKNLVDNDEKFQRAFSNLILKTFFCYRFYWKFRCWKIFSTIKNLFKIIRKKLSQFFLLEGKSNMNSII
jgi:DNA-directed RNA polymerase subunit N (RpoN/RPB10)